jgi:hypothetical protein
VSPITLYFAIQFFIMAQSMSEDAAVPEGERLWWFLGLNVLGLLLLVAANERREKK